VSQQFVGQGWAFPIRTDATGGILLVSREREIEESIRLIIGTAYGERPMRPEFGCAVHEFVYAPANPTTAGRIAHEVRASLRRWEPRIGVDSVDVAPSPDDPALLFIDIRYTIRPDNDPRNLVFPFYMIPNEGEESEPPTLSSGAR
jgi:phage baseplate assembly protein W